MLKKYYFSLSVILVLTQIFQIAYAQEKAFIKQGTFQVGCNYWASHAGTHTWTDWRPEVVEADFKQLSANGIKVLRVFPIWPDFQPIVQIYSGTGKKSTSPLKMDHCP